MEAYRLRLRSLNGTEVLRLPRRAAGHTVSYCADLRLPSPRPSSGSFVVAAIPAARSFAIRLMSFTGTGLASGKWTVPFRRRQRSEEASARFREKSHHH